MQQQSDVVAIMIHEHKVQGLRLTCTKRCTFSVVASVGRFLMWRRMGMRECLPGEANMKKSKIHKINEQTPR